MPACGYPPIADYAVIGDTRSAALISRRGSIDWLCWPRFDSPSIFAGILDEQRGGSFKIHPRGDFESRRRYLDDTNVLETTFRTASGTVRLIDLMPVMCEEAKRHRLAPFRQLLRRVEAVEGEVEIEVLYAPRPDYARQRPPLTARRESVVCEYRSSALHLRSDVPFSIEDGTARACFTLRAGERRDLALGFDEHTPAVMPRIGEAADEEMEASIGFWRDWSSRLRYQGPYRQAVIRSVLALKLLAYAPSGGIVAAPTTSLPEKIGGVRNWDYRYCWLRDASFTVSALYECGFDVEGGAFVDWLLYATRLTHPRLQILYDVFGESRIAESALDHFEGYRQSGPVRIGNGAIDQVQLDLYGEVLGAVEEYTTQGGKLDRDMRSLVRRLANLVTRCWRDPDNGIWEKRSERQQHVHAKVMAWSGLDCAIRLVEKQQLDADTTDWRRARDEIKQLVVDRGFDRDQGSFVSILDGHELDASLLYIARVGFLPPDDPRMLTTILAIRRKLGRGDLLYRYEVSTEDGLPPGEGAFLACSFWLVEALSLAGHDDEARRLFETLLARENDVGLLSEELEVESGALLGNFPQALTHIALINAALCLEKRATRSQRAAEKA
jgi:GH15 family glucan-1,4-alpha-glucosidase